MSFLNTFVHGEKLTEFLIEGHNPDARLKLSTDDVNALRQHMQTGEAFRAYVSGRIVSSGRGVWAVTEQYVLIRNVVQNSMARISVREIESFEAVRGRYGHTVRLVAQGRQYSMYGTDAELAQGVHHCLRLLEVTSSFEDKPARGTLWTAYSGPQPSAQDCLVDAKQRLLAA